MKKIINWWHIRHERFYKKSRWHLILDISLVALIVILGIAALRLSLYHPAVIATLNITKDPSINIKNNKLDFTINSVSDPFVFNSDGTADLSLYYKNIGNVAINRSDIFLELIDAAFRPVAVKINGEEILFEKDKISINSLAPGEQQELVVKIKRVVSQKDCPRLLNWRLKVIAYSDKVEKEKDLDLPAIKIISDLRLVASLYYHSPQGDQLGIGPLPPVVGVPTTYWLILKANNIGNELSNLVFSAQLPKGVELSGEESLFSGKFSYNQDSRRLIWQVDKIKPVGEDYFANFAISVIPTDTQVGKNVVLLKNLHYHADDLWTNTEISENLSDLDSSLPDDRLNRNNGEVILQ